MPNQDHCFTRLKLPESLQALPKRFTYPFYYQPHPLCLLAVEKLQAYLSTEKMWHHDFGFAPHTEGSGKMFGVLIVKNAEGEIGYLSAFSGKMADKQVLSHFVPPVFDMSHNDLRSDGDSENKVKALNYFIEKQRIVEAMTADIDSREHAPQLLSLKRKLAEVHFENETCLAEQRERMIVHRKRRKQQREKYAEEHHAGELNDDDYRTFSIQMSRESVEDKHALATLKTQCQQKLSAIEVPLNTLKEELEALKKQRKNLSNRLQKTLFQQYDFLNSLGESSNLLELFKETIFQKPPAGAGDCAAPKLLQYAFLHKYTPIAMAEFWWGASPKSEIRQHKQFYPACQGKCLPILTHMLAGMDVDKNPLIENPADGKTLPIVYQDTDLVIVNKPSGMLSVPGKNIEDSVATRIKQQFPEAKGAVIVHRLDMATSGLLVLALNPKAHKKMQQQFIHKTIKKRYVAIIEGELKASDLAINNTIELPLIVDINDRPRQMVCYENGKKAFTVCEMFEPQSKLTHPQTGAPLTKVYLYPKTGRTHQLRVHCAHQNGLNMPILGDDLYGNRDTRLHLHAEFLSFEHPTTKERMEFQVDADF